MRCEAMRYGLQCKEEAEFEARVEGHPGSFVCCALCRDEVAFNFDEPVVFEVLADDVPVWAELGMVVLVFAAAFFVGWLLG